MMLSLILLPYIKIRDILIMPTLETNVLGAENVTAFAGKVWNKENCIYFLHSIWCSGRIEGRNYSSYLILLMEYQKIGC